MTANDFTDLGCLMECEVIRFGFDGDVFSLLVVGDNEEHEDEDEHEEEGHDDCCSGLNGHLFRITFHDVKDYFFQGEECDNYKTVKAEDTKMHLFLELEGTNFNEEDNDVTLSFSYGSFDVADLGEIESPDA